MEEENVILEPENQEQEEPKLRGMSQSAILGKSYVSSYTGPEIDAGITKAYQAEFTYLTAEETDDPVAAVRDGR
jgi:hypothetical protein